MVSRAILTVACLCVLSLLAPPAGGEQFGLFTYRIVNGTVEIIDYPKDISGHVEIPAEIDGKPVTAITGGGVLEEFDGAFAFSLITSVTIPDSVTVIGEEAFGGCFGLTSVTIPDSVTTIGNSAFYQSNGLTGVVFGNSVQSIGDRAFFKCFRLTSLSFPASLTTIEEFAFDGCSGLTHLSLGAGLATIGTSAFIRCTGLKSVVFPASVSLMNNNCFVLCSALSSVVFLGNAPVVPGNLFNNAASGFRVFFLSDRSGFTTPTWRGFPSGALNSPPTPVQRWLLENNFAMSTNLLTEPNENSVSLLVAYALNLDPRSPGNASPATVSGPGFRGITFFGGRPDILYTVEMSPDLENWSSEGVNLADTDANGLRSATAAADQPGQFFRVGVAQAQ